MQTNSSDIGRRLRSARQHQNLSLAEVAGRAGMSVSTLSRIETGKQVLDVEALIEISRIVQTDPGHLLSATEGDPVVFLLERMRMLRPEERLSLWRKLAEQARDRLPRRSRPIELAMEIEELLAQLEVLRMEVLSVQKRMAL